jgi:hypothetical protein
MAWLLNGCGGFCLLVFGWRGFRLAMAACLFLATVDG